MKILVINGSARKGNTLTAIEAFAKGASGKHEVEVIAPDKLQIAPCKGCDACEWLIQGTRFLLFIPLFLDFLR